MIGRLRGELIEIEGSLALVEAAGVGYEVSVPELVSARLPVLGSQVTLITRQIFREDGVSLYGFLEPFQRRLFDLLLGVKGCGPRVALSLIGQIGEEVVATAIVNQDSKALIRASGVGARLAERIILELKDKMQEEVLLRKIESVQSPAKKPSAPTELVDALLTLGYRRTEAEAAADKATESEAEFQDQLKHALRLLGR